MCRIFELLLEGRCLTLADLAVVAGVREAQARRYVRHLGVVKGVRRTADGVQLARDLLFEKCSRESAVAAALMAGLGELFKDTKYSQAMRDALSYVAERAPQPLPTDGLVRRFRFAARGGDPALAEKPQVLETVVRAVLDSHRLRVRYTSFEGTSSVRFFEPLTLLIYEHQLYLVGREPGHAIEALRLSRFESALSTKQQFTFPSPNEYNLDAALAEVWGVFVGYKERDLEEVVLRLAPRWFTFAATHRWHSSQETLDAKEGLVRFRLRPCPEFQRWLLGFGTEVEVIKPEWLRGWVVEQARKVLARQGSVGDRGRKETTRTKRRP
jgi:predicted DNA-binding transcriptional regulator YafY